jgi:hypothetical protein
MKPEREIAAKMVAELIAVGYLVSDHARPAAEVLLGVLNSHMGRRGLKDDEIKSVVNVIRDNVRPICESEQLRGRIAAAMTDQLGKMNLRYDAPGA